jgi:hypothetical protein
LCVFFAPLQPRGSSRVDHHDAPQNELRSPVMEKCDVDGSANTIIGTM